MFFRKMISLLLLTNSLAHVHLCAHDKMQPYKENGRYYNMPNEHNYYLDALKIVSLQAWQLPFKIFSLFKKKNTTNIPEHWAAPLHLKERSQDPIITWLGHASVLIQVADLNIIADPVFDKLGFPFLVRYAPTISINDLPPIDIVILSHNHKDHMDEPTLRAIAQRDNPLALIPVGDKPLLEQFGFKDIIEKSWWQEETVTNGPQALSLSFLPAWHWSCRGLRDRNCSLWGSWMISTKKHTIYFGGDTAYGKHFSQIKNAFDHIDIALLPIAPIAPYFLTRHTHMNGVDAVQAMIDLDASVLIPIHWGTFGPTDFTGTIEQMNTEWQQCNKKLKDKTLLMLKFRESFNA